MVSICSLIPEEKESASIFRWVINVWMPNERSNQ